MAHILNKYFDHIFVIVHPQSLRYTTFNQRWTNLNYKIAKFVKQNEEAWENNGYATHVFEEIPNNIKLYNPLSTGQICCAIAHLLIYNHIEKNNLNNVLILEDDSIFNNLSNLEISLESNWDILSLFTADCDLEIPSHLAAPYTEFYNKSGTSAYAIKEPQTAAFLLQKQIQNGLDTADGLLRFCGKKIFAVYPPVCSHDDSPSIIVHDLY